MDATLPRTVIGKRYVLQTLLGQGGMGVVYAALDRLTGQTIALKRVSVASTHLHTSATGGEAAAQVALTHEFQTLSSLRHPNIISVLDYGFDVFDGDERQPYFTMEYLAGSQPLHIAARYLPPHEQATLLIQLLQALVYLHQRGVIHRDLKPANILVTGKTVKVLDFGLAAKGNEQGSAEGTLPYLAPELFTGHLSTPASDVYAVGVVAYQLLTDRLPFWRDSISDLISRILYEQPSWAEMACDDSVSTALKPIVERLLAKDPAERPNATVAIDAFCAAAGLPPPPETDAIRESFLQTAPFIGREQELATLSTAARSGQGAIWLVSGESGIGKSRLLEEVRIQTLVEGVTVLRGQALDAGGSVYQLWRDVLRWMALLGELSDLEAGVLQFLVPDIYVLLGRELPPAPDLSPEVTQLRLFRVIEDVFVRFLSQLKTNSTSPSLVLILEDLHWAGEGLGLLKSLLPLTQRLPLIVLGSYRSDETPDLPTQIPGAQVMPLSRLDRDRIAEFTDAIFGPAGRQSELVSLLHRETEGNLFFLVEVIRTLAEEAGQLGKVIGSSLPTRVISGGLQRAIQRRLSRVPAAARPLLIAAAIAGRSLDLNVLEAIRTQLATESPATTIPSLDEWLYLCTNASVLEIREGQWRFAHDKLRDGLIAELTDSARRTWHRQVAIGLETVNPYAAATLAYHWQEAAEPSHERPYAQLAGEQAIQSGGYADAIRHLERFLMLSPDSRDPLLMAHIEKLLAYAYLGLDNMGSSRRYFERAAARLGYPFAHTPRQIRVAFARSIGTQLWHRVRINQFGLNRPEYAVPKHREAILEAARIYNEHGVTSYFMMDRLGTMYSMLTGLNLAETVGRSDQLGAGYAGAAIGLATIAPLWLSQYYVDSAFRAARQMDDPVAAGKTLPMVGLAYAGRAQWQTALDVLQETVDYNFRVGDLLRWQYSLNAMTEVTYFIGEYTRSHQYNERSVTLSEKYGMGDVHTWGLRRRAMNLFKWGKVEAALACLIESLPYYAGRGDSVNEANAYGLLASVRLRLGQLEEAQQAADTAEALLGNGPPTGYYLLDGYTGIAEVRLSQCQRHDKSTEAANQTARARFQAIDHKFWRYGQLYPVGRPRAALFRARYFQILEKYSRAAWWWRKSIQLAEYWQLPYDVALAQAEWGQLTHDKALCRMALNTFERLGTPYEAQQVAGF